jgi:hypothetical protein
MENGKEKEKLQYSKVRREKTGERWKAKDLMRETEKENKRM